MTVGICLLSKQAQKPGITADQIIAPYLLGKSFTDLLKVRRNISVLHLAAVPDVLLCRSLRSLDLP